MLSDMESANLRLQHLQPLVVVVQVHCEMGKAGREHEVWELKIWDLPERLAQ